MLGLTNIILYAGVYTPLKQVTIWNTWVGAIVGAIPPMMGWAAASGDLDAGAAVLAAALFSWQMPHFLSLAWLCKDDYLRGGFRMMPFVDPAGRRTAIAAVRHCIYLIPLGYLAYLVDAATEPFAWETAILSAGMGVRAVQFLQKPSQNSARSLFRISLIYLPVLMACLIAHRVPRSDVEAHRDHPRCYAHSLSFSLDCLRPDRLAEAFESGVVSRIWDCGSGDGRLAVKSGSRAQVEAAIESQVEAQIMAEDEMVAAVAAATTAMTGRSP
eukprot:CAMPEP_0175065804 /NCGR_PEP_ID=MMETSP0052_2-20121109/16148_1 /TAXON_ID=51329 ORGANISM="Polytomella parva, Strain SAG 63-3" /NCGR_SAMPLE_ID=MMETSP0052_2 /ASSEMBLY_ACC=CAM_ASM_000194 /LENGTH=270 /DNA_ID=CAMNT_0016332419 /DNA_START=518 /DNA_END=1330 /DNA_ORIENTATION=-